MNGGDGILRQMSIPHLLNHWRRAQPEPGLEAGVEADIHRGIGVVGVAS